MVAVGTDGCKNVDGVWNNTLQWRSREGEKEGQKKGLTSTPKRQLQPERVGECSL